jgi:DNA processing protein
VTAAVVGSAAELPPEAFGAALAGLPGMGPARLTAVLDAVPPAVAWERVRQGAGWEPGLLATLGRGGPGLLEGWRAAARQTDVAEVWRRLVREGLGVALRGSPAYPGELADDIEPPAILFHRGRREALAGSARVAVVGTRRCTTAGVDVAFELGYDLAQAGVAVVSGLALGIDGAAHRGALAAAGSPPIGVVASGIDVVYPPQQRRLWQAVAEAGVLLGEAPLGARPERWRFPARNRIIAALADVVVVVESHRAGGSLHTVDEADRRSVEVMAVPGAVRNMAAVGTNALLAEGRPPVRDAGDVLVTLGLSTAERGERAEPRPAPAPGDAEVLDAIGWQPASFDQVVTRTGQDLGLVAESLERLMAAGWVAQQGGWYERIAQPRAGGSVP